ncbi:MAG: NAD-dependent epimerase/dehydratase family protein [Alphaproteobacteria bacterium]
MAPSQPEGATDATIAVTGGTGFIGRSIVSALRNQGAQVKALARRADSNLAVDAALVPGTVEDVTAIETLIAGCPVLVHCAGAVRARSAADFHRVNAAATAAIGRLCAERGVRLVLVSSLAAREPQLSSYAASKRAAEEALAAIPGLDWCAIRPPLVYGPGDRATLPLFRLMRRGFLPVPAVPNARFSAVYRDDLSAAVAALAASATDGIFEICDGHAGGYGWADLAATAATHLGRPVRCVPIPRAAMRLAAAATQAVARLTGGAPMVYPGKVRELYHIGWVCDAGPLTEATGWQPRVSMDEGIRRTFRWYGANNWL